MTKNQLVQLLYYKNSMLNKKTVSKIVDFILNEISQGVLEQKKVEIRKFGKFSIRERKAKILRHPITAQVIKVDSYKTMHYSYSAKALE